MLSQGLNKKYRMIWLVENPSFFKGKEIYNVKFIQVNPKTVTDNMMCWYYHSIAKFAFYTHRTPTYKFNKGEVFINLFHGAVHKNISFCNLGSNFDYVIYNSDFYKEAYIKYLHCNSEQLLPLGNPRNDLLFMKSNSLNKLDNRKYDKVIMWMPTFRVHKNGDEQFNILMESPFGIPIIRNETELEDLSSILIRNNILLIIKIHPAQNLKNVRFASYKNILFLTNKQLEEKNIQLYSLLGETDALITDYSSVYVDYLLTGNPIGFTIDDMNNYKTGFIFKNQLYLMPGEKIVSFENLKDFIMEIAISKDEYFSKRMEINDILNKYTDGELSKRIVEYFKIN